MSDAAVRIYLIALTLSTGTIEKCMSQYQDVFKSEAISISQTSFPERPRLPRLPRKPGSVSHFAAAMRSTSISLLTLLLLLITFFRSGLSVSRCFFNSLGNDCYNIETDSTLDKNYAEDFCNRRGGKLVSISSLQVMNFLKRYITTYYTLRGKKYWVGLYHVGNGTWKWRNNKSAMELPWVTLPSSPVPDCFSFDGAKVAYTECSEKLGFICESLNLNVSRESCNRFVPTSFLSKRTNKCFFRTPVELRKEEAEAYCVSKGGVFEDARIEYADDREGFYNYEIFDDSIKTYWAKISQYELHATTPVSGRGDCVTWEPHRYYGYFYYDYCSGRAYMLCSSSVNPSGLPGTLKRDLMCPIGSKWKADRATNYCYWETSHDTIPYSWDEALAYCRSSGGDLASFHSIEEEKIGLSSQYGSFNHSYWIGLTLHSETGEYVWSDGSPLDYTNWAPGHPNHRDKRLRCVAMDAYEKHWVSRFCGEIRSYVCKAPKTMNPPTPVLPTREPLKSCDSGAEDSYYFKGYCYRTVSVHYSWHRAKEYCENEGSSLVSIHNEEEIGFLIRLLYDNTNLNGNWVWIGLNTLGVDGAFQWTDWTPLDFTYWNDNEPNSFQGQEKCYNMHIGNGTWKDENCNAPMSFICKKQNDTTFVPIVPTTLDPRIGNCQKEWLPFQDRCYLPMGELEKDRLNWTLASKVCLEKGGYLASIRSDKEQTFLSYVIQRLKDDTWIGLHDTVQSEIYYWADNSDLKYTNWGPGEPSVFGIEEDCVLMKYDSVNSGTWKDEDCSRRHAYICQAQKDPKLPETPYIRGTDCLQPEGWLKLDQMCFKMFADTPMNWEEAEKSCERENAHLVSVTHFSVLATVNYLAAEANQSFWIGLQLEASTQQLSWLNGWPALFSKWEKNELGDITMIDQCFVSSSEGYWKRLSCSKEMAYMCQVTAGNPPKKKVYSGKCPNSSDYWRPTTGSHCYHFDSTNKLEWYSGNFQCFTYGGTLVSIHSKDELAAVAEIIDDGIHSIYIGLTKNKKGGFAWTDKTPVDFVNWDEGEPLNSDDQCVEMRLDTHRWRVTPCLVRKHFLCSSRKENLVEDKSTPAVTFVAGAVASVVVILVLIGVVSALLLYYRPLGKGRYRIPLPQQSISFENALFKADAVSLDFQTEGQEVPQRNC